MRGRIFLSPASNMFICNSLKWNVLMLNIVFLKDTQMIDLSKGDLQNTHKTEAPPSAVVQNPCVTLLISPAPERGELAFEVRFYSSTVAIKDLSLCGRICQFV